MISNVKINSRVRIAVTYPRHEPLEETMEDTFALEGNGLCLQYCTFPLIIIVSFYLCNESEFCTLCL